MMTIPCDDSDGMFEYPDRQQWFDFFRQCCRRSNDDRAGLDPFGMWEELSPHLGVAAIRSDQYIGTSQVVIGEIGGSATVRVFGLMGELLRELYNVFETFEQYFAQPFPVDPFTHRRDVSRGRAAERQFNESFA